MENKQDNNAFEYTYSAPTQKERKEIERIRREYRPLGQDDPSGKVERVKQLHKKIKTTATSVAIAIGVIGALIFGLGLTMVLEWSDNAPLIFIGGCAVCAFGCPPIALAYPVYGWLIKSGKKKHGEEITKLCNELLAQSEQENRD